MTPPRQIYVAAGSRRNRAWGRRPRYAPLLLRIAAAGVLGAALAALAAHPPV